MDLLKLGNALCWILNSSGGVLILLNLQIVPDQFRQGRACLLIGTLMVAAAFFLWGAVKAAKAKE